MSNSSAVRILILTSATGGGHDARAHALKEWLEMYYSERVEIKIDNLIEDSSLIGKFGVFLYDLFQRFAPIAYVSYWTVVEMVGRINHRRLLFGRKYFRDLLRCFRPQLIISVHDFLNRGYFEFAREVLGADSVRCVTYCGEFSGGFGYSANWVNPTADLFIARNREAESYAHSLKMAPGKTTTFSSLLPPADYEEMFSDEERRRFIQDDLRLQPDLFNVFLATGYNGQNNHLMFLDVLKVHASEVQAIVICGRNDEILGPLRDWKRNNPGFGVFIEGYSHQVHKLIQASDAIVMRGGANTASKALFYGCPIIFNRLSGCMPQENLTIRYFVGHGSAAIVNNVQDFESVISEWRLRGEHYNNVASNIKNLLPKNEHPEMLCRRLFGLGEDLTVVQTGMPT